MTLFILALSMLVTGFVAQQHPAPDTSAPIHYRVYRADGTPSSLEEIESAMQSADVLFVGESHNDPIVHFLQRQLLEKAFLQKGGGSSAVALSMEMFTRDVQYMVDEYLDGLVTESQFLAAAEPWNNYETDYRPMVEFAREHELDVVAANAPRRYANRVTRLGRESLNELSEKALSYLPPLPYAQASEKYTEQFAQAMRDAMAEMAAAREEEPAAEQETTCECECPMMGKMMSMHHDDDGEEGMEHGEMEGMEHGEMGEMDHAEMMRMHHGEEGMEHGEMEGMEHGEMGEMDHAEMMRMHHGEEGMEHGEMEGMEHGEMGEMEHGEMEGMEHGEMGEMDHGEMGEMDHAEMMRMHHGEEGMEHGEMEGDDDDAEEEMEHGDMEEMEGNDSPVEGDAAPSHGMAAAMPSQSMMLDSQSLWDATMAYSISEHLKTHPGVQVMHVVGSFHVNTGTGIPEHLARYSPDAKMLIISVEPTEDINRFDPDDHADLGDFVILSDESLPRTFDSTP